MLIEEAKERIRALEAYIKKIENYKPQNFEQELVYLYVQHESVTKVTAILNEKGYREGNRKLNTVDISKVIRSKPKDELHEMAKKRLAKNVKKAQALGWL